MRYGGGEGPVVPLDLLTGYDARTVRKTMGKQFRKPEPGLRKSLTLGQGHEDSGHRALAENLGIDVYFCHPHPPWENANYLIQDMLYPVNDFRELTRRDVSLIAKKIDERPRKTLDFKIPKQVFSQLR
jgi:IS30 family transposase